jgi:signal transduction histidine kinase
MPRVPRLVRTVPYIASLARDPAAEERRGVALRAVVVAIVVAATAVTSQRSDWEPVTLVLALAAAQVAAEAATVTTRRIRISAGLLVQTTIMAVLGPGPAVAAAFAATLVDWRLNRVSRLATMNNLTTFTVLGLIGGLLFDGAQIWFGLETDDAAYALLVLPVYIVLSTLNLFLVVADPRLVPGKRLPIIRDSAVPSLPLELLNGVLTCVAVFVCANAGAGAAVALVMVLAVTIPLARTVADAIKRGDDLTALRLVSDERAAEVSRLSLDRDRLLTEVLQAEARERGRLAGSLHDGPMQRLMAMRQDAAPDTSYRRELDETIAETRALISAFHPATVRELGFEASLRAAIAPFPAARSVRLTVETGCDDRALAASLLLPIAQELVVNAVKHADPSEVAVVVREEGESIVLEVDDDGVGIDTQQAGRAVQAGHVGLAMVRRRVEDAGGRLDLATRTDGGTHSRIAMPVPIVLP